MNYNIFTRPRLPRNRYGYDNLNQNGIYSSNSIYGSSEAAAKVGADMESLDTFTGATFNTDGQKGLVPAPLRGQQDYFIKGDGAWTDIPAYRWMSEFPADEGLEKRGLQVNGDFNVTDTLNTFNLNVEGQAHFWELVIDKAKMQGGQIFVSPSLFQIDFIETSPYVYPIDDTVECWMYIHNERPDIWQFVEERGFTECRCARLWMRNDDGSDHTTNEVQIGDMMRCRTFNLDGEYTVTHIYKDVSNTDYHSFVLNRGEGTFTDLEGLEHKGFWIDLVYSIKEARQTRSRAANVKNYSLNTYFEVGQDPDQTISQEDWTDLKAATFNVLCGSTDVEYEDIISSDAQDYISDYDFRVRGVAYILSEILGVEYEGDDMASMYSMMEAAAIADNIVNGTEEQDATELINEILGGTRAYDSVNNNNEYQVQRAAARIAGTNDPYDAPLEEEIEPQLFIGSYTPDDRNHWLFGYGIFNPQVGQQLGCLGHMWDKSRQNAIVISAINPIDPELEAPSIAQYKGIDTFGISISKFRLNTIAKNGSIFTGKFMVQNEGRYLKVDDLIELYVNDIETGLETVGIHLDGENSTIKMVGNVELHQHSDKPNDTLNVYGEEDILKVQIKPTEIGHIDNIDQTSTESFTGSTLSRSFNIYQDNNQGVTNISEDDNNAFFSWNMKWRYQISPVKPYVISGMATTVNLGTYAPGTSLKIRNIVVHIDLGKTRFRSTEDLNMPLKTAGLTSYVPKSGYLNYKIKLEEAVYLLNTIIYYRTVYETPNPLQIFVADNQNVIDINLNEAVEYINDTSRNRKYRITITSDIAVCTDWTTYSYDDYDGNEQWFHVEPKYYAKCDLYSSVSGNEYMEIGTNGMVYSNGNGNYFYSGADGIAMQNNESGISLINNDLRIYQDAQIIRPDTTDKTVSTEFVVCDKGSSNYTININNSFSTGEIIKIIGFNGLKIQGNTSKPLAVYKEDTNAWTYVDYILLAGSTEYTPISAGLGGSDVPYLTLNKRILNLIVGPNAMYIDTK